MTCLRAVMNGPERWSRSAGQRGAERCRIPLHVGSSTCDVSTPPPHITPASSSIHPPPSTPPLGPDQSINASQAAAAAALLLLLRSPSASLHSAYTRLTELIAAFCPVHGLQAGALHHLWWRTGSVGLCVFNGQAPANNDHTAEMDEAPSDWLIAVHYFQFMTIHFDEAAVFVFFIFFNAGRRKSSLNPQRFNGCRDMLLVFLFHYIQNVKTSNISDPILFIEQKTLSSHLLTFALLQKKDK